MTQQSFIEFVQHLNYLMGAATLQMNLQSKAQEANNYIEKNIDKKLWGGNPWHLILDDATKLREDCSMKARTIAIKILFDLKGRSGFGHLIEEISQDEETSREIIQELTDIIKKELENE